ncbi:MAG: MoaD/ThiS family protein [Candidimonas sp.]|nr:MAG: MoaD/ThiS family protein [Candidimonas sp.]TAM25466.1 MAG: MoaD/ThiS family protein [Candidimonas sp.]TAM73913.1 MAG: MoaD/ThiS family protein [Candidimonas sp.]
MSLIRITVNGKEHTIAEASTLEDLLTMLSPSASQASLPMATAVNGSHVARQARATRVLSDQDAITTFEPITGG